MLSQLKVKFSVSGTSAQQKQLRLPRLRYDEIALNTQDLNIVDAATTSGENFQGIVDKIKLGEGANLPVYAERNELHALIDFMTRGVTTGKVYDPDMAADNDPIIDDVTRRRSFTLTGPFQLRGMANPVLDISLRAVTDEFGSATAFTATLVVLLKVSAQANQNKPGYYWHREYRTTDTRHELPLGPSMVVAVGLVGATGRTIPRPYVDKVKLPAAAPTGSGASTTVMDVDVDQSSLLEDNYMAYKQASAPVAERYWIDGLKNNPYADRRLILDLNTTSTMLCFAKNLVG
jgi:hypothetical protein